jgi:hypothetical protein
VVKVEVPPLLEFLGDWSRYVEVLYEVYIDEIAYAHLTFLQLPVRCKFNPPSKGKGFGFWHVIQDGPDEEERIPDLRRCERIRWIPWLIRQAGVDQRITWWEEKRGSTRDVLLWFEEMVYVVVLAKRRNYLLLKTAYCTEKPHKKRTLKKRRAAYWSSQKA